MAQPAAQVQAAPDPQPQEQPFPQATSGSVDDVRHPQVQDAPAQDAQWQTGVVVGTFVAFVMIGSSCVVDGSGDTGKDAAHGRPRLERNPPSGTNASGRFSDAASARTDRASRRTRRGTRA